MHLPSIEIHGSAQTLKTEAVAGKCSIEDLYQNTGPRQVERPESDDRAGGPLIEEQDCVKEKKELHAYLDMKIEKVAVRCSIEDLYQNIGPPQVERPEFDDKASGAFIEEQECIKEKKDLHAHLDMKTEAVAGRCSIEDLYQNTGPRQVERPESDDKAVSPFIEEQDYVKEINELHAYLDMMKSMVRPGCSREMLIVALNSMSSLFNTLTFMLSTPKPHASL